MTVLDSIRTDLSPHVSDSAPPIDREYLVTTLQELLEIPSPSGYTDSIVRFAYRKLEELGLKPELTRRGAIRATLLGCEHHLERAMVSHLDTLGAMIRQLKPNGRLTIAPIGTWSARWAEGARVTIFTDLGHRRGTILPLKASGHAYNDEIDTQPVGWDHIEVRVDELARSSEELFRDGFRVGDFVAIDPQPEILDNGYVVSRHLDDKAGVACMLAAAKHVVESGKKPEITCHLIFTISEEVGTGACGVITKNVAEMVSVDNSVHAPDQNSSEHGVTVAMMDSSGPFDYHLTRHLLALARDARLLHTRDVYRYYRSDAASAVEGDNDIRTALVCFGLDASHGYERTHVASLVNLTQLLTLYIQSAPSIPRDEKVLGGLEGFPEQHSAAPPVPEKRSADSAGEAEPW